MQQATSRSVKSDMTASNAESWARLRLVQGESSTQKWELTPTQGNATVTVGTSPDCTWVVQDEGVRAVHFSLHWDGRTLRIADVYSAGDVRVDGALLSSQWLPLLGRVRIEFGSAAMVAESAIGGVGSEAEHPPFTPEIVQDSAPAVPRSRPSTAAPRTTTKGTLIGVIPSTELPTYLQAPSPAGAPSSEAAVTPSLADAGDTSRPRAPAGSLKATLVGGVGLGGAPGNVAKNKPNATLMGFNAAEVLRGVVGTPSVPVGGGSSVPGGSLGDLDQRTVQGFPAVGSAGSSAPPASSPVIAGRRMTQKGVISRPPGVLEGAVAHAPVRAISEHPGDVSARIGSAWQEVPEADAFVAEPLDGEQSIPRPPRTPRISTAPWDIAERLSEIPTQMRDHASFATSRRRRRGLRWHHVAVLLLTVTAYFAWLYLLDHW